jgi:hypothetical protein
MEAIGKSQTHLILEQVLISDQIKLLWLSSRKAASTLFSLTLLEDSARKCQKSNHVLTSGNFGSVQVAYTDQERLIGESVRF